MMHPCGPWHGNTRGHAMHIKRRGGCGIWHGASRCKRRIFGVTRKEMLGSPRGSDPGHDVKGHEHTPPAVHLRDVC